MIYLRPLTFTYRVAQRYLKNGNSDLENSTILQIANSILYNFYFMSKICFNVTDEGLNFFILTKSE